MSEIHESYEDYLKAIYLISKGKKGGWTSNSDISNFLKVKPSSVTNMLYNLKENELITWNPRKSLRLTKKGKKIALSIIKNYNSLHNFFIHVLKLQNENIVHKLSCEIEHHINPEISTADMMQIIKGPDFPTGGIIYGKAGILGAYSEGRGLVRVRARTHIEGEDKKKIIVTELPYQVNKSKLLQNIAELVKNKKIEGIGDLRDESDRDGMRVVIDLKRDAIEEVVILSFSNILRCRLLLELTI